jgi:hypothetical protein
MSNGLIQWPSTNSRWHGRRYIGWSGRAPWVVLEERLLLANCPSGRHSVLYVGWVGVVVESGTAADESSHVMGGPCGSA